MNKIILWMTMAIPTATANEMVISNPETVDNVLNCRLSRQVIDRVLHIEGICPQDSDPSYVVGYFVAGLGYPTHKVKGRISKDKFGNKVIQYQVFIKPPAFLTR